MMHAPSLGCPQLDVLLRLAEVLAHARSNGERVQVALDCVLNTVRADLAAVGLLEGGALRLLAVQGKPAAPAATELALCTWLARRTLALQRPLELGEARQLAQEPVPEAGLAALLGVPFKVPRRSCEGVLCLGSRQPQGFSAEQVKLLTLMAERLGLELEEERLQALTREQLAAAQRFQAIFQHATDAILVADDTGRYTDANPAACDMLGMTHSQLMGRSVFEVAGVPQEHTEELWRQFLTQGEQRGEFELLKPDGRRVYVEYTARAHLAPGQHLSMLREVTRRKRAESLLSLLTEASEVLVGSLDPVEALQAVPRLAVKLLGDWALVALLGESELREVAAAHRDPEGEPLVQQLQRRRLPMARLESLWQALRADQVVGGNTTPEQAAAACTEDAEAARLLQALKPHAYLVVPLATRERMLGLLALVSTRPGWLYEDEDRVAALELARLAALALENARLHEQARLALRLRQEMMAAVAHDVRNPLNALLLRAMALQRRAERGGDEATQADGQALVHLVRQVERLLFDLVDLASIEAGRLTIEPRPQQVESLLAEALELLGPLGQQQGIQVELQPSEGPRWVLCDRSRILQVLSNLVGNALKFTPCGGRVVLRVTQQGDRAVFSVSDTGVGIKAEELPHVFDRYWRSQGARETAGLGLGLAIARGLVQAHGGMLWAESQPGQGSTFFFTLPVRPEEH